MNNKTMIIAGVVGMTVTYAVDKLYKKLFYKTIEEMETEEDIKRRLDKANESVKISLIKLGV